MSITRHYSIFYHKRERPAVHQRSFSEPVSDQLYSRWVEWGGKERWNLDLWEEQDAKMRFSELLNATIKKGPQIITRCGIETAVLVMIEEWNRLKKAAGSGLRASVGARDARFKSLIPEKRKLRRRAGLEHVQLSEKDSRRDLDRLEKTLGAQRKAASFRPDVAEEVSALITVV